MYENLAYFDYNIWNPSFDYIIVGNYHRNYIQTLRIKIEDIKSDIKYLNTVINDPELFVSAKEILFIPQLLNPLKTRKFYEKQASLLAA